MEMGVDLVKISRITNANELASFILSNDELGQYHSRTNKMEFLAGRFAAKEAFLKMKHSGLGTIPFKEIEVFTEDNGAPYIKYQGKVYGLSISHDGDYAIAICYEK